LFPQKTFLRILVGVDGSESSVKAADNAISLAKHYGSELIAIHVIPSKSVMGHSSGIFGVVTPAFLKKVTEEAEMWFAVIKKNTVQLSISLKTQIISTCESPIKEIVEFAHRKEVDLIVVGTRGRSGIKRILLGSTASGVVTYAHCPVFIVK
jgi:nucleotide-binding universal stress UspA family protein